MLYTVVIWRRAPVSQLRKVIGMEPTHRFPAWRFPTTKLISRPSFRPDQRTFILIYS